MALIGYARVSTNEQHLHLQQDALSAAGCLKIYTDTISGAKSERKGLAEALDFIRDGDTLIVWRLDRLAGPHLTVGVTDTIAQSRPTSLVSGGRAFWVASIAQA